MSDFMMTSLSAQNDSFGFIQEGSTKRKEILAKFLDLQVFDQMHKLAKQDSSELKGVIKHLNSADSEKKLIDKLEDVHPMKQVAYASVIQVTVLFGMFGCMAINQELIKFL
jgi:DNA repair exonuclease SbcCD ATPase subunit